MAIKPHFLKTRRKKMRGISHNAVRPGRVILLGFLGIIVAGMLLLHLPIAARSRCCTPWVDCLFTSAAATCVTGLTVVDTWEHWSFFGRSVILLQVQIGGLGVMAVVAMMSFVARRTITMRERLEMSAELSMEDIAGVVRLTRNVLLFTLAAEGAGALILALRFVPQFGWGEGLEKSIFHAVSAFCNAGFDLMGEQGVAAYATDPLFCIVIMLLVVMGGLGFIVWRDLAGHNRWSKLTVHTRLVVITSIFLLLAGYLAFFVLEYSNPETLGDMTVPQRALAAAFQSATCRSAGFAALDQSALRGSSVMVVMILMFIGGSPGSTAGGVKTISVAVLVLASWHVLQGHRDIVIFNRRIDNRQVLNVLSLVMVGILLTFTGALIICAADGVSVSAALFESVATFSTAGMSQGLTPTLGVISKLWLVLEMYLGRVGVLTLSVAVLRRHVAEPKITYPEGRIIVG